MRYPGTFAHRAAIALLFIISLSITRPATALAQPDAPDAEQVEAQIQLAREHLDRADFNEAIRLAGDAAARIADAGGATTPAAIDVQILLAECYNSVGRYDEALDASRAALARSHELHGDAHPVIADALAGLSTTMWRRADHAEAERLQHEALTMRREFFPEISDPVMSSHAALGLILNSDSRFEESVASHEPAIAIGRELHGGDHADLASMLSNYSIPLQHLRRFDDAEAALNEALAMTQRLGRNDDPTVAYMIQNLGALSIYRNDLPRAYELYREVETRHLQNKGETFEGVVAARMALGKISYRMDDVEQSRGWYAAAAQSYELSRVQAGRGIERAAFWETPYEKLAALEVELGGGRAAWVALENARSRTLADVLWSMQTRALNPVELAEEDILHGTLVAAGDREAELARAKETEPDSSGAHRQAEAELFQAQNDWDAFQRRMAARYPASEEHTLPMERVQAALPPDGALVGWLDVRLARPAPTRWAYVIRPTGDITWIQLRDGRHEITDRNLWIKPIDLRKAIVPEQTSALGLGLDDGWPLAASLLHEQWIAPITPHLDGVKHLVAVPCVSLAGAPLEAFLDADGVGLGERFTISYAPSATIFAWLTEQDAEPRDFRRDGLLVADPPFRPEHATVDLDATTQPLLLSSLEPTVLRDALAADPTALSALPRLSWSRREVDGVAAAFPRSDQVVGIGASEPALRRLSAGGHLADYRFLHFATHALVDARSPQRSALVLSQVGEKDGVAEGLLTAAEIAQEWSLDADLVTLSACETALGRDVVGEGVVGFSYPLLQAGARCLLLSLWQVDDRATALLMERFYAVWSEGEVGKDAALQEAKRWLREYRDPDGAQPYAHPFYWSSFVLMGAAG